MVRDSHLSDDDLKSRLREISDTDADSYGEAAQYDVEELANTRVNRFDDRLLRVVLDELLLVLITCHDGACGKDLRTDLQRLGYDISPGTLYPRLHDLVDRGVLECHERVRTKEFSIADADQAQEHVDHTIDQLSDLAVFLANNGESTESSHQS